ncbi:MAG: hypothetical protein K0R67_3525 [Paenibacillus sp.]|nr:hypothetical protein [Paenibacillus sp.]
MKRFSKFRFVNNEDCLTKAGGMAERVGYPGVRQAGREGKAVEDHLGKEPSSALIVHGTQRAGRWSGEMEWSLLSVGSNL